MRHFSLAPDGRHMIVSTSIGGGEGRGDKMPHYVTSDGYVKTENVRSKVGTDKEMKEKIFVIDIEQQRAYPVKLQQLAGINEDPLLLLKKRPRFKQTNLCRKRMCHAMCISVI